MKKEEFIKKSIEKFGDTLNYDNVPDDFHWKNELLTIFCKVHGKFEQTADAHRQSKEGCPKCGKSNPSNKFSNEKFIEIINEKYPKREWEVISVYKNMHTKVNIQTKYGICSMLPMSLVKGAQVTISSAVNKTEYFIKRFIDLFHSNYDFSKFIYTTSHNYSIIICKNHGEFKIKPYNIMSGYGCPKCGMENISLKLTCTIDKFIEKAKIVHGDKYDYSKSVYPNNNKEKININCKLHGLFSQTVSDHLTGYGCKECGKIIISKTISKIHPDLRNITSRLRSLISSSFRRKRYKKNSTSSNILNCSWEEFKNYLEDNPYGFKINCPDVDLDHIIPISDAKTKEELYLLNQFTNFQLLPKFYNRYIKKANEFNRECFENWMKDNEYNKC